MQQIRPGRPTDNGAVERLHQPRDGFLLGLGAPVAGLHAAPVALDAHLDLLHAHVPRPLAGHGLSRRGPPPLTAYPHARHSGRPYDPAHEAALFDLAAVDRVLAQWQWHRPAAPSTGQISVANKNVRVGAAYTGQAVALRFAPSDRQVVIYELGTAPGTLGREMRRLHGAACAQDALLGTSALTTHPAPHTGGSAA